MGYVLISQRVQIDRSSNARYYPSDCTEPDQEPRSPSENSSTEGMDSNSISGGTTGVKVDQLSQPGAKCNDDGGTSKNPINASKRIEFETRDSSVLSNAPPSTNLSGRVDNIYGGVQANVLQSAAPTMTADMRVQTRITPFLPFFFWVRAVKIEHNNDDLALEVNRRLATRVLTKVHRSLCKSSYLYVYAHECTTDDCLARHPYLNKSGLRVRPIVPSPNDQPEELSGSKSLGQKTETPEEEQTKDVSQSPGKKVTISVSGSKAKKRARLYFPSQIRSGNYGVNKLAANSLTLTPASVSRYPSTNHFMQDPQTFIDYRSMEGLLHAFYIETYELIRLFVFPEVFSDHFVIRRFWGSFESIARVSNACSLGSKLD